MVIAKLSLQSFMNSSINSFEASLKNVESVKPKTTNMHANMKGIRLSVARYFISYMQGIPSQIPGLPTSEPINPFQPSNFLFHIWKAIRGTSFSALSMNLLKLSAIFLWSLYQSSNQYFISKYFISTFCP